VEGFLGKVKDKEEECFGGRREVEVVVVVEEFSFLMVEDI
jgi:hypothetical protein